MLAVLPPTTTAGSLQTLDGLRARAMGCGADLLLDSAHAAGSPDRAQDALAQRDRSLEHDAENRVTAVLTASQITLN